MSILTKIFVVLVTILSVGLVALIVPFVANTENFRSRISDLQAQLAVAEAKARDYQVEINAAQDRIAQQIEELNRTINTDKQTINNLQSELARARDENRTTAAELAQEKATVSLLSAAENQNATLLASLQRELGELREEKVTTSQRLIELADANNELAGDRQTLERNVRRLQEQLTAIEEQIATREQQIAALPQEIRDQYFRGRETVADARGYDSDVPIQGQVTKVSSDAGETFVQINVGERDQVKPNMRFLVYRDGNQYVGTIVVSAVDTDAAAGRVVLSNGQIAEGDRVYTGRS